MRVLFRYVIPILYFVAMIYHWHDHAGGFSKFTIGSYQSDEFFKAVSETSWLLNAAVWLILTGALFQSARPIPMQTRLALWLATCVGFFLVTKTTEFGNSSSLGIVKNLFLWCLFSPLPLAAIYASLFSTRTEAISLKSIAMACAFTFMIVFGWGIPDAILGHGSSTGDFAVLFAWLILIFVVVLPSVYLGRFVLNDLKGKDNQNVQPVLAGSIAAFCLVGLIIFDISTTYMITTMPFTLGGWMIILFPFYIIGLAIWGCGIWLTWRLLPILLSVLKGAAVDTVDFGPIQPWVEKFFPTLLKPSESLETPPNTMTSAPNSKPNTVTFGKRK